jgi:hypothetical protein
MAGGSRELKKWGGGGEENTFGHQGGVSLADVHLESKSGKVVMYQVEAAHHAFLGLGGKCKCSVFDIEAL